MTITKPQEEGKLELDRAINAAVTEARAHGATETEVARLIQHLKGMHADIAEQEPTADLTIPE
jgi:hypothetical protein